MSEHEDVRDQSAAEAIDGLEEIEVRVHPRSNLACDIYMRNNQTRNQANKTATHQKSIEYNAVLCTAHITESRSACSLLEPESSSEASNLCFSAINTLRNEFFAYRLTPNLVQTTLQHPRNTPN